MAELSPEQRDAIDAHLDYRLKGFESTQENIILNSVKKHHSEVEAERRSRLQFVTALGGVGLVAASVLVWDAINNTARTTAQNAVSPAREELESIVDEIDTLKRDIVTSRDIALDTLEQINRALGEIEAAQGRVAYLNDIVEIRSELDSIKNMQSDLSQIQETLSALRDPDDPTATQPSAEEWLRQQSAEE